MSGSTYAGAAERKAAELAKERDRLAAQVKVATAALCAAQAGLTRCVCGDNYGHLSMVTTALEQLREAA